MGKPTCPECGNTAVLRMRVYNKRWECDVCSTRVGCYHGTDEPNGTMATKKVWGLRTEIHTLMRAVQEKYRLSKMKLKQALNNEVGSPLGANQNYYDENQCLKALRLLEDALSGNLNQTGDSKDE